MSPASLAATFPACFMPDPDRIPPAAATPASKADAVEDSADAESVRLMLRVREGDERAFEKLVELHQSAVVGTVYRMLSSLDDAHDIAQQVFVRVWRSAPRYEPTAKFTTWLYTITRNLVFNETRRRSRRKEVSLDEEKEDEPMRQIADLNTPAADESLAKAEFHSALENAIAALPEKQRMAVILRGQRDLPYEEICSILKLSLPALKSLLFRARNDLRKHLARFLGESDVEL
jgi:RNA polymerase sigma-70 factor, ECF subfamily